MVSVPFVHVQARGSHRELGRAVGEAAREPVHASVDFFREHFTAMTGGRLTFGDAERQAKAYEREARLWSPDLVEELEGLAEGSGVPFSRLLEQEFLYQPSAIESAIRQTLEWRKPR